MKLNNGALLSYFSMCDLELLSTDRLMSQIFLPSSDLSDFSHA